MLAIVLVFGIMFVECASGSIAGNSRTDSSLNGTWLFTHEGSVSIPKLNNGTWYLTTVTNQSKLVFDNGSFLFFFDDPYLKGNYTTDNNKITFRYTHLYGGDGTNGWYSIMEINDNNITDNYEERSFDYSLDGNVLTIYDINYVEIFIKL
jgi:hypothetical protein